MIKRLHSSPFLCGLLFVVGFGCRPGTGEADSNANTGASESMSTSEGSSSGSSGASSTTVAETSSTGAIPDMGIEGALCSLILQDCPSGQKCVAWNMSGGIIPDGVKCVDEVPNADGIGEPCTVTGNFGSGDDSCIKGAMCFDIDNNGEGSCVGHCSGEPETPICQKSNETCVTFFEPPVPLCFTACDPLVQNCPEGEGCYMDAPVLGSEGFVCMPTVLAPNENGDYKDLCYNQAGCAPGFSCIWPKNVPNCKYEYCCSPWCDLELNPEICGELDATLECVPWYEPGNEQPGLKNLGICALPL